VTPEEPARPNFLVLLPDSLRADRGLGPSAPSALQELAQRAAVFDHALAPAGWTIPSLAGLMTGRYPVLPDPRDASLRWSKPDARSFAETLAAHGYRTAAFVGPDSGALQGALGEWFHTVVPASGQASIHRGASAELAAWLRAEPQGPFLAVAHDIDLRFVIPVGELDRWPEIQERCGGATNLEGEPKPLDIVALRACLGPDDKAAAQLVSRAYDQAVAEYDRGVAEVLAALDDADLAEHTVVVFTSPHGHHLGENGRFVHSTLYEPDLRVPLLWAEPGGEGAGSRLDTRVQLIDVGPSILARAGVEAEQDMDGRSLLPLLGLAEGGYAEGDAFALNDPRSFGIRSGGLELQRLHGPEGTRHELYDLSLDPLEQRNLWADPPPEAALPLLERLLAFEAERLERGPPPGPLPGGPRDEALRQQLRDHGYWRHVEAEGAR